ncbi:MAG: hypothetical protein EOO46_07715 [Flavobacterium sp.]|nr:MAG: hypothetical protein EOO46_07715 [Flavobacterium sp.]
MKDIKTKLTQNQTAVFSDKPEERQIIELVVANKVLAFQNKENIKYEAELKTAHNSLTKIQRLQKKYIKGLEEMMFLTSHAVRKPVANIIGIATQLDNSRLPKSCRKLIECLKISASSLDVFTQQLTAKINTLKKKGSSFAGPHLIDKEQF